MVSFALRRAAVSVAVVAALLASVLFIAAPAMAGPYPPRNHCALSNTVSGTTLTITGSGYHANTTVHVRIGTTSLGTVRTDSSGGFRLTVTVPSGAGSASRVVAAGGGSSCSFPLSAEQSTSTPGGQPSGHAASTGFATLEATSIAALLLLGGFVLVAVGRRRRHG